jgi:antirestriction protein ArdC
MSVADSADLAMARAVQDALVNGERIGPAIDQYVRVESFPSRLRPAEVFLQEVDFTIHLSKNGENYYSVPEDRVFVCDPYSYPFELWLSVTCHELLHASEIRCGWQRTPAIGELRAEVGQAILEKCLGLPFADDGGNYQKWIKQWQSDIERDDQYVFDAVDNAVAGVKWLINRAANSRPWSAHRQFINSTFADLLAHVRKSQETLTA